MSHFDPGKQMQLLKERFIRGAGQVSQVEAELAAQIWDMMAAFAGYGFPKAHAASYAQISWRSAWCKAHFPAEFIAAVLANWGGYYSQRIYLSEARHLGLKTRPPHINHSQAEFSASYPDGEAVLYMGLDQVKDLTRRTIANILKYRPFHSVEEFLLKVDPRPQEAENLVRCGGLDGLAEPAILMQKIKVPHKFSGQLRLFEFESPAHPQAAPLDRCADQEDILGLCVDIHPLEKFADRIPKEVISSLEARNCLGQRVQVAGIRQSLHRSHTSKGETMAFLSLEDLEGSLDVVIFPGPYKSAARFLFDSSVPMLVTGMMESESDDQEPYLRAEKIEPLDR